MFRQPRHRGHHGMVKDGKAQIAEGDVFLERNW